MSPQLSAVTTGARTREESRQDAGQERHRLAGWLQGFRSTIAIREAECNCSHLYLVVRRPN